MLWTLAKDESTLCFVRYFMKISLKTKLFKRNLYLSLLLKYYFESLWVKECLFPNLSCEKLGNRHSFTQR